MIQDRVKFAAPLVLLAAFLGTAPARPGGPAPSGILRGPDHIEIPVRVAVTREEKRRGFSGIRPEDWDINKGILFFYDESSRRQFWMPDTHFDLDIFFLDENFRIVDLDRDVPHHPGRESPPPIARTRWVHCRHVLELPSDSPSSKRLKKGMRLTWIDL